MQKSVNYNEVIKWTKPEDLGQFHNLSSYPPLHSVVIETHPEVAEQILRVAQARNRPINSTNVKKIQQAMMGDQFILTGDTIKVDSEHKLQDGQHRLEACFKSGKPMRSHWVFGLDPDNFDVLDEGRKRTPGDILALSGVAESNLVAATIRRVLGLEGGNNYMRGNVLNNREIGRLARERFQDIEPAIKQGRRIALAISNTPPSLAAAICYKIGQYNQALAETFVHEWTLGARTGRNVGFDNLQTRINTIARSGGGSVNPTVRGALIVQTFNAWNANEVPAIGSLKWQLRWTFPQLEFDAAAYKKRRRQADEESTTVHASQLRIMNALAGRVAGGEVQMSHKEIGEVSKVPVQQVPYFLGQLIKSGVVQVKTKGKSYSPSTYTLNLERMPVANSGADAR